MNAARERSLLHAFEHARAATPCSPQSGPASSFARLFVVFAPAHFFLDSAALNELAEATDRFLNAFAVPHVQLNHTSSFGTRIERKSPRWGQIHPEFNL